MYEKKMMPHIAILQFKKKLTKRWESKENLRNSKADDNSSRT